MTIKVGILGAGAISGAHSKAILGLPDIAKVVAVADLNLELATTLAAQHNASAYSSLEEMLKNSDLDVVTICTPPNLHADQAEVALAAGKHVMLEKPADTSVAAVDRIIAAAKAHNRLVGVISQHRFDPSALVVHSAIAAGRFGRLTRAAAQVRWWRSQEYFDAVPWRGSMAVSGGGALISQSIHTLDLMLWMLGEVQEVFAYSAILAHERIEVEDHLVAVLTFTSGALGVLEASIAAYPGLSARLEVSGDRGSAIIDSDELEFFHAAQAGEQTGMYGAWGSQTNRAAAELESVGAIEAGSSPDPAKLSSAHQEQFKDFFAAILEQRPPTVTLLDARYALLVIEALHLSAATGQPVPLRSGV